ncbi:hypothetical protein D9613_001518 [Agrocybe pediades]|uniref:Rhodopsin domain-containing protein n=1 Tax=Agrocybe pediades TaxID=84607 RepID=A0A8H4VXJ4_9AGAR|nr:hypothetical protein D9613_001518 [Agrocybe pediades]
MLSLAKLPSAAVTGLTVLCHSLAISTTSFRLLHRCITRRLWWDDFWAAVAFVMDLTIFVLFLVGLRVNITTSLAANWITLLCYNSTLWAARMTVAVTIVRLIPRGIVRRVARGVSVIFALFWTSIIVQNLVACTRKGGPGFPWCTIVPQYALYTGVQELVTNLIADIWLLLAPAYILYRMKLQRPHYVLILTIFLCGIFTALASISHAVFLIIKAPDPTWMILTGHIELAVAVIVSNLLVLVTYLYRVFRSFYKGDSETPRMNCRAGDAAVQLPSPDEARHPGDHSIELTNSNSTSGPCDISAQTRPSSRAATLELTEITLASSDHHLSSSVDPGPPVSVPFSSFSYPGATSDA